MKVSPVKDQVYPMEATKMNQVPDPWQSELWAILKPFVYLCRIFGSNYMTDSRWKWAKLPFKVYCAISFLNHAVLTGCYLRIFNSSEGLKPDTIIKISGVLYMALCLYSMIFNLRFQFKIESILAVSLLINGGKVPNAKFFQRRVTLSSVAVVVGCVTMTVLTLLVAVPSSPIAIPTKLNIFNSEIANIVYLSSCYILTAGFNITIAYLFLLCSLLKEYVIHLQEAIKEIPNSLMIEKQLKAWRADFRLLLALNDRIQDTLGWITFTGTALYSVQMVIMSLCFARGNLSTSTAVTLAVMTGFGFAGLLAQLLPVTFVNEKVLSLSVISLTAKWCL